MKTLFRGVLIATLVLAFFFFVFGFITTAIGNPMGMIPMMLGYFLGALFFIELLVLVVIVLTRKL